MEMLNRAIDGAALFKDMLNKVESGASAAPVDPEIAAWNIEVDRKRAEKLERKRAARLAEQQAEIAKLRRP